MKKQMNCNYAFVFYDIKEKRVYKVFKICKKYFSHYQKSVFRGETTPSKMMKMKKELANIIVEEEDVVAIIELLNENSFRETVMGKPEKPVESLFI